MKTTDTRTATSKVLAIAPVAVLEKPYLLSRVDSTTDVKPEFTERGGEGGGGEGEGGRGGEGGEGEGERGRRGEGEKDRKLRGGGREGEECNKMSDQLQ